MLYLLKDTAKRTVSKGCSVNHFVAYLSSQGNFDVRIQRKYSNHTKKCQQVKHNLVTMARLAATPHRGVAIGFSSPVSKSKRSNTKWCWTFLESRPSYPPEHSATWNRYPPTPVPGAFGYLWTFPRPKKHATGMFLARFAGRPFKSCVQSKKVQHRMVLDLFGRGTRT